MSTLSNTMTSMVINDYPTDKYGDGLFSYRLENHSELEGYTDLRLKTYIQPSVKTEAPIEGIEKLVIDDGIEKNPKGSPNAEIVYKWEESE